MSELLQASRTASADGPGSQSGVNAFQSLASLRILSVNKRIMEARIRK